MDILVVKLSKIYFSFKTIDLKKNMAWFTEFSSICVRMFIFIRKWNNVDLLENACTQDCAFQQVFSNENVLILLYIFVEADCNLITSQP